MFPSLEFRSRFSLSSIPLRLLLNCCVLSIVQSFKVSFAFLSWLQSLFLPRGTSNRVHWWSLPLSILSTASTLALTWENSHNEKQWRVLEIASVLTREWEWSENYSFKLCIRSTQILTNLESFEPLNGICKWHIAHSLSNRWVDDGI